MTVEYKEGCECCSVSSSSISSVSSSSISAASVDSTPISSVSSASESSASSSSLSSASESSVTPCDCACCIEEDITGILRDETAAFSTCNLGNSDTFTLSYKSGAKPTSGVAAGESVGSWWRGDVDYCEATLTVTVYCLETKGGCDNFWAYVEEKSDYANCILNISAGDIGSHIRSGTATSCTCDPLSVAIGAFAGVGDSGVGCCCEGCDDLSASDCDFAFRLELTE